MLLKISINWFKLKKPPQLRSANAMKIKALNVNIIAKNAKDRYFKKWIYQILQIENNMFPVWKYFLFLSSKRVDIISLFFFYHENYHFLIEVVFLCKMKGSESKYLN